MNIHQPCFLVALMMLFSNSRFVDCELDWVEFCISSGISGNGNGNGNNENNGNGNGNNGNGNNGNGNNGNGNGNNGNGNGNNGNGNNGNGNGNNGNGNNGNGNGNNGNGNNGNGNGNNGNGNSNNGNNNNGNNADNQEANVDFYMQTICDARIASFVMNCTESLSTFTLDSVVLNSGEMVLEKTQVTNLDCTHLCAFLSECVFFTYQPSGSLCQIFIVGSDTPSQPMVWRKTV